MVAASVGKLSDPVAVRPSVVVASVVGLPGPGAVRSSVVVRPILVLRLAVLAHGLDHCTVDLVRWVWLLRSRGLEVFLRSRGILEV